jgi:hypothetical protein
MYCLAVALGLWPAFAGVSTTLLYLLTWWPFLPVLGLLCIAAGVLSVIVGGILLQFYGRGHLRYGGIPKRRLWVKLAMATMLLLANFPLAVACLLVGDNESSKAQITFVNDTTSPITAIALITNGTPTIVGDLPPKSQRQFIMRIAWETEFKGTATTAGASTQFMIDPYPEGGPMRRTVHFRTPATQPTIE